MKVTVGVLEADLGSVGGHRAPSPAQRGAVGTLVRKLVSVRPD